MNFPFNSIMFLYNLYDTHRLDDDTNLTHKLLNDIKQYVLHEEKNGNYVAMLNCICLEISSGLTQNNFFLQNWSNFHIYLKTQLFPNTYDI